MNVETVKENNRCVSCGLCYSICTVNAIRMEYDEETGFYRPKISNDICINCGKCLKQCPTENIIKSESLTGEYKELYLAHSCNDLVRKYSTSGGVINSLVRYLHDTEEIEAVLMTGYDSDQRVESGYVIITSKTSDELLEKPRDYASRYVSVPTLCGLKEITDKYKKVAVIGTPCQIHALSVSKWGNKVCRLIKIGITCSGGMSYKATEQYKQLKNMCDAKMYYRGDGWPGKNTLIAGFRKVEYIHNGSLFERMFSSQIFKNPGCRNCIDHFAEDADISFCDFWNVDEMKSEHTGNSCVIIRSEELSTIFKEMIANGYVKVVRSLTKEELVSTQSSVLNAKKSNLHEKLYYKLFVSYIDLVFKHKLYKKYKIDDYKRLCYVYRKICDNVKL